MNQVERQAYSMAEIAAMLGVAQTHVANQVKSGAIPSWKMGRRILIPRAWLEQIGTLPSSIVKVPADE